MKTLSIILFYLMLAMFACDQSEEEIEKEPEPIPIADFTTEKMIYKPGDSILLQNSSENAYSWKWIMPDGTELNSRDPVYIVDSTSCEGGLSFKLTVFSESGVLSDSITRGVTINHIFKDDNYDGHRPSEKRVTFDNGVCILSASAPLMSYPKDIGSYLDILISANNNQLAPGTYEIQPDRNVTGGKAYISIIYPLQESYTVTAESGQLTVTITDEGMINVNYKDVSATGHSIAEPPVPVGNKLTGDLTFCPNFQ